MDTPPVRDVAYTSCLEEAPIAARAWLSSSVLPRELYVLLTRRWVAAE